MSGNLIRSIRDTDGGLVDLRRSSAVAAGRFSRGPFLWLMFRGQAASNDALHLNRAQARRLRDALDRWLGEFAGSCPSTSTS